MKYYSQAGEDKYLFDNLISLAPPKSKHYIEIGALDGVRYSNTKFFEDFLGWSGVLIEPNPESYARLKTNRPSNTLLPCLISNNELELEFSYYANESLAAVSGITSTLTEKNRAAFFDNKDEWFQKSKELYFHTKTITPISFDAMLEASPVENYGFCSIDVEGHELEVLQSFSFNTDISIFLIERNPRDQEIEQLLESRNYVYFDSVAHNNVFLSREYSELVKTINSKNAA